MELKNIEGRRQGLRTKQVSLSHLTDRSRVSFSKPTIMMVLTLLSCSVGLLDLGFKETSAAIWWSFGVYSSDLVA